MSALAAQRSDAAADLPVMASVAAAERPTTTPP